MQYTCIIIDDEFSSREVLKTLLEKFCPQIKVIGEAENADEAYVKIMDLKPDVIFLDVQMPGGNGFSLLKRFKEIPFQVVFVTSYDQYAIEAIRCSALYYLMKPIQVSFLKEAIERIENKAKFNTQNEKIINLLYNEEATGIEKKLAVHNNDTVVFLPINEIVYLEGMDEYTKIHTKNDDKFTSSRNLGKFEEILQLFPQFLRINKSLIINLNFINNYTKGEPCFITLNSVHTFEVSRRKKQEFLERMQK